MSENLRKLAAKVDAKTRARFELQLKEGIVTPIVLAKLLSTQGNVPPQMIYNYIKKERIAATLSETQKKVVDVKEAERFVSGYLKNRQARLEAVKQELEATNS